MWLSWVQQVEQGKRPAGNLHDEEEGNADAEGSFFGHFLQFVWLVRGRVGNRY